MFAAGRGACPGRATRNWPSARSAGSTNGETWWFPCRCARRETKNGFNLVELFARLRAKRLAIPYRPLLLMRTRPRPEKYLLDCEDRWESVRGAFAPKEGERVDNSRILLLDDVMTTGATLDACSRAPADADAAR